MDARSVRKPPGASLTFGRRYGAPSSSASEMSPAPQSSCASRWAVTSRSEHYERGSRRLPRRLAPVHLRCPRIDTAGATEGPEPQRRQQHREALPCTPKSIFRAHRPHCLMCTSRSTRNVLYTSAQPGRAPHRKAVDDRGRQTGRARPPVQPRRRGRAAGAAVLLRDAALGPGDGHPEAAGVARADRRGRSGEVRVPDVERTGEVRPSERAQFSI